MKRLLAVLLVLLGSFGMTAPAQAQSKAAARWHGSHSLLMLRGDVATAAGVVTPGSGGGGVGLAGTNVWTGSNTFTDSLFFIVDNGDATKKMQFELSGITTGNTWGGIVPSGTAAAPLTTISGQILIFGSWNVNGAGDLVGLNTGKLGFISAGGTGFAAVGDAYFMRDGAAASLQMGVDLNGAAINQSLSACDGITGTDISGCGLTLSSGLGTGAAVSNPFAIARQVTKATGTTAQTSAPAVIVCPTKILSNTSATLTNVASITTTSTTGGSVTYDYTVIANNGTLQDVDGGMVKVSWNNNAGTVAAAMTAVVLQSDSDASGTLAATPTATVATNVVSINLTPTWVTIVPTSVIAIATFTVATVGDTVTCK